MQDFGGFRLVIQRQAAGFETTGWQNPIGAAVRPEKISLETSEVACFRRHNRQILERVMRNLIRKLTSVFRRGAAEGTSGSLGNRGEDVAARFLRRLGYRIVATQHRNALGEVDIIAADGQTIVFVEVKTRSSDNAGQPFEAVDQRKQERLTRAALAWLKAHRRLEAPARFDVVSIVWPESGTEPVVHHIRNAFEATGRGQMFS